MASPPLEGRLLLVRERRHAALEILGAAARRDRPDLELHLRLEALPRRVVEEPLRAPECERRSVRNLARERLRRAGELRVGHDARHEPPLESLAGRRSEEHTSELQSQSNLVCRLLLEKKTIVDGRSAARPEP